MRNDRGAWKVLLSGVFAVAVSWLVKATPSYGQGPTARGVQSLSSAAASARNDLMLLWMIVAGVPIYALLAVVRRAILHEGRRRTHRV